MICSRLKYCKFVGKRGLLGMLNIICSRQQSGHTLISSGLLGMLNMICSRLNFQKHL